MKLSAKVLKYGDDISTDLIIAGKHTKTLNLQDLALHAMEDIDPEFGEKVKGGAFLVAGSYFGCGSSREQAPVALKEAGVVCVAAKSFARIFYRNAINIGLPLVECDTSNIREGDILEYELGSNRIKVLNTGQEIEVTPLPDIMIEILKSGGITEYFKERGGF
ncbi:MAG TPA: 3-isopropylmalate dehydratase small subunit [Syntrophomonas sp.]|nr:3-isopropylmalate dehydratase small subunit [Syntrophomonas sp.]